jgi:hypothetical protein
MSINGLERKATIQIGGFLWDVTMDVHVFLNST